MGIFDDREELYEKKFARDEELEFKAHARANKLLALRAAQEMGYSETEALKYAIEVVEAGLTLRGDWDVVKKIGADMSKKGISKSDDELRTEHIKLLEAARKQLTTE